MFVCILFSAYGTLQPGIIGRLSRFHHVPPHWNESSKLGKLQPPTSFGAKYRAKQPAFLDKNVWPKRVWVILISLIYSKIVLYMFYTIYFLFWCFFAKNETCERLKWFAEKYKQKTRKWSNLMLQDSWKYHPCKSFLDVSTHGLKKWWPFFIFDPIRCGKKPSWWKLLQRKRRFNPSLQRIWNTFSTRKFRKKLYKNILLARSCFSVRVPHERRRLLFRSVWMKKCFVLSSWIKLQVGNKNKPSHVLFICLHSAYIRQWSPCALEIPFAQGNPQLLIVRLYVEACNIGIQQLNSQNVGLFVV